MGHCVELPTRILFHSDQYRELGVGEGNSFR